MIKQIPGFLYVIHIVKGWHFGHVSFKLSKFLLFTLSFVLAEGQLVIQSRTTAQKQQQFIPRHNSHLHFNFWLHLKKAILHVIKILHGWQTAWLIHFQSTLKTEHPRDLLVAALPTQTHLWVKSSKVKLSRAISLATRFPL